MHMSAQTHAHMSAEVISHCFQHTEVSSFKMQLSHTHTGEGVIILSCGFAHTTEEILRNQASVCNTSKTTFTEACKQAKKHLGVNTSKGS